MQTVEEQVLPFVPTTAVDDNPVDGVAATKSNQNHSAIAVLPHQSAVLNGKGQAVAANDRLANFHRKMNKIILDNIAIAKEKERLVTENNQLEDLIAQYIAGTKITESTLQGDNPLMVINGR